MLKLFCISGLLLSGIMPIFAQQLAETHSMEFDSACADPNGLGLFGRPDFGPLIDFLSSLTGREVHYHPNPGNAGDKAIDVGFYLLAKRARLNYTRSNDPLVPASADVVLYGGGGVWCRTGGTPASFSMPTFPGAIYS